jgi:hypothetical protein
MSLSVASNWLWNFGIGYATPYLVDHSTTGVNAVKAAGLGVKVFFIWGSTCLGCFLFAYFFIPETRGLSLEQINLLYKESTSKRWQCRSSLYSYLFASDVTVRSSTSYRAKMIADNETYARQAVSNKVRSDDADDKV